MKPSTVCLSETDIPLLLSGDLPASELATAEDHLGHCTACRQAIEATIADADWWQEAKGSLAQEVADDANRFQSSSAATGICDEQLLELLGPTDDPAKLGRIGTYEIVGILGRGGMGAVFKGHDAALNRFVAIKMLLPHLAASGAARKRFAREAQAAAAVVDDHVMAIHAVSEWKSTPYFVMPYSRGISLQKRLTSEGPLEVREILRIGLQVAKGLAAAHSQGLVHRDVKPANIFLDEGVERVRLMDFGLARAADDASLTRTGVLAGTPQYMSPEQARAEQVDHRSDLFSLGSVLYAMCVGHSPFRAESSYSVLRLISDKHPRPIREINADIPEWFSAIVARLMAKEPNQRFDSASEVTELLEGCLAHVQEPTITPLPESIDELNCDWGFQPQEKAVSQPQSASESQRQDATGTRPSLAGGRIRLPPIRKLITAAAFAMPLLFLFGVIVFLQTGEGTISIETNSEVDVPILIRQGDQVVQHFTVSQHGAATRLNAGKYIIEVEGDGTQFTVEGAEFRLNRGETWIATIKKVSESDPKQASHPVPGVYESGDHSFGHNRGIVGKVLDNWEVIVSLEEPDSVKIGERLQVSRPQPEFDQYWNFAWIEIVEIVSANEGLARARVVQTRREQNGNRFDWMKLLPGDHVSSPDGRTLEEAGIESPKGSASEVQITAKKARASYAAKLKQLQKTYSPRHPEMMAIRRKVERFDRLLAALKSFEYPNNGKNAITVWRQSTTRSGRFSATHNDDVITLFDAIDSFEDRCATMDKTAIAVFSEDSSEVEFVDYTASESDPDEYTINRGQLVILMSPKAIDDAGMMGMESGNGSGVRQELQPNKDDRVDRYDDVGDGRAVDSNASAPNSELTAAEYRKQLKRLNETLEVNETAINETKQLIVRIEKNPDAASNRSTGITPVEAQRNKLRRLEKMRAEIHAEKRFTEQQLLSYLSILEQRCRVDAKAKDIAQSKVDTIQGLVEKAVAPKAELAKAQLELDEAKLKLAEADRRRDSYQSVAEELQLTTEQPTAFLDAKRVTLTFSSGKASLDIDTGKTEGPRAMETPEGFVETMDLFTASQAPYVPDFGEQPPEPQPPAASGGEPYSVLDAKLKRSLRINADVAPTAHNTIVLNELLSRLKGQPVNTEHALVRLSDEYAKTPVTWFVETHQGTLAILQVSYEPKVKTEASGDQPGYSVSYRVLSLNGLPVATAQGR